MFDGVVFILYRTFALPFVVKLVQLTSALWPEKIQTMIAERRILAYPALTSSPIWIHAASGEIEYAKPVIRQLKQLYPQTPILVTYFSPSAKKLLQNFPGIDAIVPLPWDRVSDVQKFLTHYQPKVALFARTDVWPEVAYQLSLKKIPSALFSATFSDNSRRRGLFSGPLNRWAFNHLSQIFCSSLEDQRNLESLGVKAPIQVQGDTRYDQVQFRLQSRGNLRKELRPAVGSKVFVAGSTWPQDEAVLLEALEQSIKDGWSWLWAPHEVSQDHLCSLENKISAKGFSCVRYSQAKSWQPSQVLILDVVGILAEIYTWGSVAFVGGSFKDKIHSVMEPLAAGLPVLVGPYHKNNREAIHFRKVILSPGLFAVSPVQDAKEIQDRLRTLGAQNFRQALQAKIGELSGAAQKMVTWVNGIT